MKDYSLSRGALNTEKWGMRYFTAMIAGDQSLRRSVLNNKRGGGVNRGITLLESAPGLFHFSLVSMGRSHTLYSTILFHNFPNQL